MLQRWVAVGGWMSRARETEKLSGSSVRAAAPADFEQPVAGVVAAAIAIEPTILDELIESGRGSWEGQSVARIAQSTPALHAAFEAGDTDFAFPGGESLLEQVRRTRRALDLVASGPGPALVVAHAGTIRAALIAIGRDPPPERELPHGEAIPLAWPPRERPRA